jgi:hypothetical protein
MQRHIHIAQVNIDAFTKVQVTTLLNRSRGASLAPSPLGSWCLNLAQALGWHRGKWIDRLLSRHCILHHPLSNMQHWSATLDDPQTILGLTLLILLVEIEGTLELAHRE